MKIKPLNSNVLIEIVEQATTKSGIILTGEAKKLEEAKVLAVSDEVEIVKVGDVVLFKEYDADEIELDDKKVCFLSQDSILGIKK